MDATAPVSPWLRPTFLAKLGLGYAAFHLAYQVLLVLLDPSPTWTLSAARIADAFSSTVMIALFASLTMAVERLITLLRDAVLPELRRR